MGGYRRRLDKLTKTWYRFRKAIGHLNAQDIIAVNRPERSFSIHRLVGARILNQLDDADQDGKWQATFDMAVELLFDKFPRQEIGLWLEEGHETCQLYLHHIQSLARHYRNLPGLLSRNKLYELLHSSTWYEFEIPFLAHQCRAHCILSWCIRPS